MWGVAFVTPGQDDANSVIYQRKVVYKFITVAGSNQLYFCADNILLMYFETTFRSFSLSPSVGTSPQSSVWWTPKRMTNTLSLIYFHMFNFHYFLFLHISFVCCSGFCFQFYLNVSFKLMIFLFEFAFRYSFLSLNVAYKTRR